MRNFALVSMAPLLPFAKQGRVRMLGITTADYASVSLQRISTLAPGEPLPQGWMLITDSQGNLRATRI